MELHYFLTTNGSGGHYSFLEKETTNLSDCVLLQGYPREVASVLVRECYAIAKQHKMNMDLIHNCMDDSLEGIIFPDLKTSLINRPVYEERTDVASLFRNDSQIQYQHFLESAKKHFETAKKIHDDWEKIYINVMDFNQLDAFTEKTASAILPNKESRHQGSFKDRFFGSATINGPKDYIDVLSDNTKRYFIKGRPGTGKSTFMKKIAQKAYNLGYHVERYHCSFDPNSLDMVVIRELSVSIFDSTAPHEYFPTKSDDEILDLYAVSVPQDTDVLYKNELTKLAGCYKAAMNNATKDLIAANEAARRTEEQYRKQIDDNLLMNIRKDVIQRIFP